MYCFKCGKEIKDGSAFCSHCGVKQGVVLNTITDATQNQETVNRAVLVEQIDDSIGENTKAKPVVHSKHHPKGLIIAVISLGTALLIVIAILVVFLIQKQGNSEEEIIADSESDVSTICDTDSEIEITTSSESETTLVDETDDEDSTFVNEYSDQPTSMTITIVESDGTEISGTFKYTYEGDKLTVVTLYDENSQIPQAEMNPQYDENGNCTFDYSWGWGSNGLDLSYYYLYYDENNYLIGEERADGMYYDAYENDENGNPIHVDMYRTYDGVTELYMTDDMTYDELGRLVSVHRENFGGGWTNDCSYYYDGTSTEPYYCEVVETNADGVQSLWTFTYTYEYDSTGRLTKKVENKNFGDSYYIITSEYEYE